jgi:hypothetical protein
MTKASLVWSNEEVCDLTLLPLISDAFFLDVTESECELPSSR